MDNCSLDKCITTAISDPVIRPSPLNYHERTMQVYPSENSLLQENLLKIQNFTLNNRMVINEKKSNLMVFNKSRKIDFLPEFAFKNGNNLEVVDRTRLLGVIISSDIRWQANTLSMCSGAMAKMWLLRRMKLVKLEPELILDYYIKEVRPVVEQAVPIWNSGLTKSEVRDIEKIQKLAMKIIFGHQYISYQSACDYFGLKNSQSGGPIYQSNLESNCTKVKDVLNTSHPTTKLLIPEVILLYC